MTDTASENLFCSCHPICLITTKAKRKKNKNTYQSTGYYISALAQGKPKTKKKTGFSNEKYFKTFIECEY